MKICKYSTKKSLKISEIFQQQQKAIKT